MPHHYHQHSFFPSCRTVWPFLSLTFLIGVSNPLQPAASGTAIIVSGWQSHRRPAAVLSAHWVKIFLYLTNEGDQCLIPPSNKGSPAALWPPTNHAALQRIIKKKQKNICDAIPSPSSLSSCIPYWKQNKKCLLMRNVVLDKKSYYNVLMLNVLIWTFIIRLKDLAVHGSYATDSAVHNVTPQIFQGRQDPIGSVPGCQSEEWLPCGTCLFKKYISFRRGHIGSESSDWCVYINTL